jgi:hypothetical protein
MTEIDFLLVMWRESDFNICLLFEQNETLLYHGIKKSDLDVGLLKKNIEQAFKEKTVNTLYIVNTNNYQPFHRETNALLFKARSPIQSITTNLREIYNLEIVHSITLLKKLNIQVDWIDNILLKIDQFRKDIFLTESELESLCQKHIYLQNYFKENKKIKLTTLLEIWRFYKSHVKPADTNVGLLEPFLKASKIFENREPKKMEKVSQETHQGEGKDFVKDPKFRQSYSSHSMKQNIRCTEIARYKSEVNLVRNLINESLLEDTTFNQAKPILIAKLKTIEKIVLDVKEDTIRIHNVEDGIHNLQEGQKLTMTALGMLGKELGAAIEDLKEDIKELKYKPITRQLRKKLALRDAIYENHYELFMLGAGDNMNNKFKFLKTAQLRIIYTLLYFLGLRLNQIKMMKKRISF